MDTTGAHISEITRITSTYAFGKRDLASVMRFGLLFIPRDINLTEGLRTNLSCRERLAVQSKPQRETSAHSKTCYLKGKTKIRIAKLWEKRHRRSLARKIKLMALNLCSSCWAVAAEWKPLFCRTSSRRAVKTPLFCRTSSSC